MRLPAEWEPQSCIWLSWPSLSSSIPSPTHPTPSHWQHLAPSAIAQQWARLAATISLSQIVAVNAPALWHDHIRASVQSAGGNLSRLHLYPHETNDVWCRDHGAIFIQEQGQVIATDCQFNGWGGNYAPWDLDNTAAQAMATAQGLSCRSYP